VMDYTVDAKAFLKWVSQVESKWKKANSDALLRTARTAAVFAKRSGLFKNRTYALQRSIRGELVSGTKARTIADAPHAHWVENGNTPRGGGLIKAKGRAMHFWYNGAEYFRKTVKPAKPMPYMKQAREKVLPYFSRYVAEAAAMGFK